MDKFTLKQDSNTLFRELWTHLDEEVHTDAVLLCPGKRLPVHKVVLSARSEYFRVLFQNQHEPNTEVHVGMEPHILESLLQFMYTGTIRVKPSDLTTFLDNARHFQVRGILNDSEISGSSQKPRKRAPPRTEIGEPRDIPESTYTADTTHRPSARPNRTADISNRFSARPNRTADTSHRPSARPNRTADTSNRSPTRPNRTADTSYRPSGRPIRTAARAYRNGHMANETADSTAASPVNVESEMPYESYIEQNSASSSQENRDIDEDETVSIAENGNGPTQATTFRRKRANSSSEDTHPPSDDASPPSDPLDNTRINLFPSIRVKNKYHRCCWCPFETRKKNNMRKHFLEKHGVHFP